MLSKFLFLFLGESYETSNICTPVVNGLLPPKFPSKLLNISWSTALFVICSECLILGLRVLACWVSCLLISKVWIVLSEGACKWVLWAETLEALLLKSIDWLMRYALFLVVLEEKNFICSWISSMLLRRGLLEATVMWSLASSGCWFRRNFIRCKFYDVFTRDFVRTSSICGLVYIFRGLCPWLV